MSFRLFTLSACLLFSTIFGHKSIAQVDFFTPAKQNPELLKSLSSQFEKKYLASIETLGSEYKKDYKEIYKERLEYTKQKFDKNEIYVNEKAQHYLDNLANEIVKANPLLQNSGFKCYFSRSHIPNASYLGEGLIVFNMGLFTKLDNESQVVFVLCHEIAHYFLNHSANSIRKYVTTINSKELQNELKRLKKMEFGKREELEKLLKGLTFSSSKHSRDHESQADSMAIELMRNTRFDVPESIIALAKLDTIDTEPLKTVDFLQQAFNATDYPFQKKWVKKESGLLGGHAEIKEDKLADSLKTHPECKARISVLEPLVNKYNANKLKSPLDAGLFADLKKTFLFEIIEYAFESDNYTCSLFYTLQLLEKKPGDPYLITQVGKIMNGFYIAQKAHRIGKVYELPSPWYLPNYNILLQFIQNLHLENYALLSFHFLGKYKDNLMGYPQFLETYMKSSNLLKQL